MGNGHYLNGVVYILTDKHALLTKKTSLNTTHSDGDSETAPYRILCEIVIHGVL